MLAFAPIVMNARIGAIINIETGVQGGDQIGYGVGNPHFFGTANGAIGGDHAATAPKVVGASVSPKSKIRAMSFCGTLKPPPNGRHSS